MLNISACVLAGTPGPYADRAISSILDAGYTDVLVVDSCKGGEGLPSQEVFTDSRVRSVRVGWTDNFAATRNAALEALGSQVDWVIFVDADEWVVQPVEELCSAIELASDGVGGHAPLSPPIVNVDSGAVTYGVPRVLQPAGPLAFVGRVHECCEIHNSNSWGEAGPPVDIHYQVMHDGYDPSKFDQKAKALRNAYLGDLGERDDPSNLRTKYFALRDRMPSIPLAEALQRLRCMRVALSQSTRGRFGGIEAEWYFSRFLSLVADLAVRNRDELTLSRICGLLEQDNLSLDDAVYYDSLARVLWGVDSKADLIKLIDFRSSGRERGQSIAFDGEHLDALISVMLERHGFVRDASNYRKECDPWTDAFFAASVLR